MGIPPSKSTPQSVKPKRRDRASPTAQSAIRVSSPSVVACQLADRHRSMPLRSRPVPAPIPWWGRLGALVLVLLAGSGMVGCGWMAAQLIVNPQGMTWLNQFVPGWVPKPVLEQTPKTQAQIRQELHQAGKAPGAWIMLGENVSVWDGKTPTTDWLVPVMEQHATCLHGCDRIVELHLYQTATDQPTGTPGGTAYYALDQLAIAGLEESFVIAPLVDAAADSQGSSRALPLTQLERFEQAPTPGIWLNLSGRREQGDDAIAYGQVFYYHPHSHHLSVKAQWTSPTGQMPVWKAVTGGKAPELVVNHTLGMEPSFEVYQVKPLNFAPSPVQLEPISLTEPALDDSAYRSALMLARNRLWSTSVSWLQGVKQRRSRQWNETAQAQLDLVRWHSQATQAQADGSWATPSQQVLANLVDGRWERALTVFQTSVTASQETAVLLKGDQGRIEKRVKAALRVSPAKLSVKVWGALLVAAQQSPKAAIAWLQQQPKTTTADRVQINALIQRLDPAFQEDSVAHAPGRIIGEVQAIAQVNPADWRTLPGTPPLNLASGQRWYRVQVRRFHDGTHWQTKATGLSSATSAETLWQRLGRSLDSTMQLLAWDGTGQQHTAIADIRAARVQSERMELLVAGAAIAPSVVGSHTTPPLAVTEAAVQWLAPATTSLSDWILQNPQSGDRVVPILIEELQRVYPLPMSPNLAWATLEQYGVGQWTVQTVALTQQAQPEVMLTIHPQDVALVQQVMQLGQSTIKAQSPRTLIFSSDGKLLYSECSTDRDRSYRAIVDFGENTPIVIADTGGRSMFLQWSVQHHQFEALSE